MLRRSIVKVTLIAGGLAASMGTPAPPGCCDGGRGGNRTEEPCAIRKFPVRRPGEGYGVLGGHSEGVQCDRTCHPSKWVKWWYGSRARLVAPRYRVEENSTATAGGAPLDETWRDEVRKVLREAASSREERLAMQAALALGRGGDGRDAAFLARIVADAKKDGRARAYAALGLGLIRTPAPPEDEATVTDALFAALDDARKRNDDDLEFWCCAAWAIGLRASPASHPRLQKFVADGVANPKQTNGTHPEVTSAALTAMGLTRDTLFGGDLRPATLPVKGADQRARHVLSSHAMQGIALLGDTALVPAVREAAKDTREDVRRAALLALGALADAKDDASAALLVKTLANGDDMPSQVCAALSLGLTGHASGPAALLAAEKDASGVLHAYVMLAIGVAARKTGDAALRDHLVRALKDGGSLDERGALCIANGLSGNPAAVPLLIELASGSGEPQVRANAACALGIAGAKGAALPVLRELVRQETSDVLRYEAALALGRLGDAEVLTILGDILETDRSVRNRATAAVCLGRVGGRAAAPLLLKLYRDEKDNSSLRPCIARALGFLIDRTQGEELGRILEHRNWWVTTEATEEMYLLLD